MEDRLASQAEQLHRALTELVKHYHLRDRNDICCHGISVSQCYALTALGEHDTLTMQALADGLQLAISTVTRLVDQLVDKQLVQRHSAPHDRRVCCVSLTAEGSRLLQTIEGEFIAREQAILQRIPADARDHVVWAVEELSRAVNACCQT